jgi:hypothetical protein
LLAEVMRMGEPALFVAAVMRSPTSTPEKVTRSPVASL